MTGFSKKLASGKFWVILFISIIDEFTPFLPIFAVFICIGLFSTRFMRMVAIQLLDYCDQVSEGEYCLVVQMSGEKRQKTIYCPFYYNDKKTKQLRVTRARLANGEIIRYLEGGYEFLEVTFIPKGGGGRKN